MLVITMFRFYIMLIAILTTMGNNVRNIQINVYMYLKYNVSNVNPKCSLAFKILLKIYNYSRFK